MTRQYPVFGEVINGLMWDGTDWVPVDGLKPGDQINDQMWTGTHWVEVGPRPSPPQDKLRSKWWFWLILAVSFLLALGMVFDEEDPAAPQTTTEAPQEPAPEKKEEPKVPGIDDPVVDGDLQFTVTDVDTDIQEIPGTFNQVHEPLGSYTLVDMTIKNTGDSPVTLSWTNVSGTVTTDAEIQSSAVASYYANPQGQAGPFIADFNPGAKVDVTIVFDVPTGLVLETVVGHDSVFSDGAVITLP